MSNTRPRPIDELMDRLRTGVRNRRELLVCLDFDGTLARIVDDPREATLTPATKAALEALESTAEVSTAVVSGRGLEDVRDRVPVVDTVAGNHGLELARNGSIAVHPVARRRARIVDEVCSTLRVLLREIPNCHVENKRLTATVHVRSIPPAAHKTVGRLTRETVERVGGDELELSTGKAVFEIGPAIPWGKGEAVTLIDAVHRSETFVVYVGDDVTDESAFHTVEPEGVGVRVGDDRPTAASCRVSSPADVASLLHWFSTVAERPTEDVPLEPLRNTNS